MPTQCYDPEFEQRVLTQFMELFVNSIVKEKQDKGELPRPFTLKAAQVIFFPDERQPLVRVNSEVRILAKVKFKAGKTKAVNDTIYANEIEDYEALRLPDNEDPNCGHMTLVRLANQWMLALDFIYNKKRAAEHLSAARQFITTAQQALSANSMRVFVDTCFSAAELAAKALLLTAPRPGENIRMSHKQIHARYKVEANLGNVDTKYKDALHRLIILRDSARYLNNEFNLKEDDANSLIQTVEDAISFVERRVQANDF